MRNQNGIATIGSCLADKLVPAVDPGQLTYVDGSQYYDPSELVVWFIVVVGAPIIFTVLN